jgi:hypothetical protein
MQTGRSSFPDPDAISGDWLRWHPIGREDALRICAFQPVAVVYRNQGVLAADWLDPDSRFFRADQPYLFDGLRYYADQGAQLGHLQGVRVSRPLGEMETLEVLDAGGEPVNIGSPVPGAPAPKKKVPVEFRLVDAEGNPMAGVAFEAILPDGKGASGNSDAEGFIRFPDNIYPGETKLKLVAA